MKAITLFIIVGALAWGGWTMFGPSQGEEAAHIDEEEYMVMEDGTLDEPIGDPIFHALVTYTDNGFDNKSITIKKGETVRFTDQSANGVWVASADHPTHTKYPEKNEDSCLGSAFDTCRVLMAGEFWEFTFNEVGSWGYHNHKNSSHTGVIEVTEE